MFLSRETYSVVVASGVLFVFIFFLANRQFFYFLGLKISKQQEKRRQGHGGEKVALPSMESHQHLPHEK